MESRVWPSVNKGVRINVTWLHSTVLNLSLDQPPFQDNSNFFLVFNFLNMFVDFLREREAGEKGGNIDVREKH